MRPYVTSPEHSLLVPTLRVGTQFLDALRPVPRRGKHPHGTGRGAARRHSHAERGNESAVLPYFACFAPVCVC
jgi:hypothetical protein